MISVVIPTKNEEDHLPNLLRALDKQTLKPDEIIVVDDFSTDRTAEIAESYGCKVYQVRSSIGKARHIGTMKARGNIVFQTDADAVPTKTWIEAMTSALMYYEADIATGCIIKYKDPFARSYERITQILGAIRGCAAGANMCYSKKSYMKTRGFPDTNSAEDVRLVQEFREKGLKHIHILDPRADVYMHYSPLKWLINEIKNYAPFLPIR